MKTIQLSPAYVWDCDECGTENFVRAVVWEGSDEDLAELRAEHGVEPWEAGGFMTMPNGVTCEQCEAAFATQCFDEDDE